MKTAVHIFGFRQRILSRGHRLEVGRCTSGFTLVEMLVGAVLLGILTLAVYTVLTSSASISAQTTAKLNCSIVARECLDLIGRDLQSAQIPWDRWNPSSNTASSYQFITNPTATSSWENANSIFWQAPVGPNSGTASEYGNVAEVGYFVVNDVSQASNQTRLQLRRFYVPPTDSSGALNSDYKIYNSEGLTSDVWLDQGLVSKFAPTNNKIDVDTGLPGWVADGVIAMWARPLDKEGNVIAGANSFNSREGYSYKSQNKSVEYPEFQSIWGTSFAVPKGAYNFLPGYVEVALICVAPQDISRIRSLPTPPVEFPSNSEMSRYVKDATVQNPGVKSIEAFSRKYRIYNSN
jgi:uncharacterized protein (TIGR02599 family)